MRTYVAAFVVTVSAHAAAHAGGSVTLTENIEGASGQLGPMNLKRTAPLWSDPRITARTLWRGTTAPARSAVFTDAAAAGNASAKAALDSTVAHPPESFFFGFRAEFFTHEAPLRRARFSSRIASPASASADIYISAADELWTVEPISLSTGVILDRVFMGMVCTDTNGCFWAAADYGDPLPMLGFAWNNCPPCVPFTSYIPLMYLESAPAGANVGDTLVAPVGSWFRLTHEFDVDGVVRLRIDFLDGQGAFLIREDLESLASGDNVVDSYAANGGFVSPGSPMFVDNIVLSGHPLICDGDANGDGLVDFNDLNITLGQYSTAGPGLGGDFNGDQQVNFTDLNMLLGRFNTACE